MSRMPLTCCTWLTVKKTQLCFSNKARLLIHREIQLTGNDPYIPCTNVHITFTSTEVLLCQGNNFFQVFSLSRGNTDQHLSWCHFSSCWFLELTCTRQWEQFSSEINMFSLVLTGSEITYCQLLSTSMFYCGIIYFRWLEILNIHGHSDFCVHQIN